MLRTNSGSARWALAVFFCLVPFIGYGEVAAPNEAKNVARNWVKLIVERDGSWGGARSPLMGKAVEFRRGDLLLGYYVPVIPQGYVLISSLKDLAPIKAYATTNTLDPDDEVGMCDLLKDVMERRLKFMSEEFGGPDSLRLQGLRKGTFDANRTAWSTLLEGGGALRTNLESIYSKSNGPVGPLLQTRWHQGSPYNTLTPSGYGGAHTLVGCVATAMAQIMRYYCWPPFGKGNHTYGWDGDDSCPEGETDGRDLYADFSDSYDWVNMPDSSTSTSVQEDAVAELSYEVAAAVHMDFGCCNSGAYMSNIVYADAGDAFEDYFYYNTPGNKPVCESRDDYEYVAWWEIIKNEIDHNRPMTYNIVGSGDFNHLIVVDGYDNSGGQYQVHANYGWNDAHTAWYTLDLFDCSNAAGWQGGCDPDKEELLRFIYPRDGLFGAVSGTVLKYVYSYIYGDVTSSSLTVEAGAWVQCLGGVKGTKITCSADSISICSSAGDDTRFFSKGDISIGMKLSGGTITIRPRGSITVH